MISGLGQHPGFKVLTRQHKQSGAQDTTRIGLIVLLQADAKPKYGYNLVNNVLHDIIDYHLPQVSATSAYSV